MCESAIDTIQVIKTVQNVETKHNWAVTCGITAVALLINWTIYLLINNQK